MNPLNVLRAGHFLLFALLLAGCVTTQDRFGRAFEAEHEGDPYRAARAYAEVLRRDPGYRDARVRFERTALEARDERYARAERAHAAAEHEAAVAALDDVMALRTLAGEFGVALSLPVGYQALHDAANEAAVRALFSRADTDASRQRYDDADGRYERALRFSMPAALRDELDRRRVDGLLAWADHAAGQSRYRQSYNLAARVLAYTPRPAAGVLEAADDLQTNALDAGTEHVAFLPVLPAEAVAQVPAAWPGTLSERLNRDFWSAPPLFVASVSPRALRRELGRMGRRAPFTRSEAVGIGRAVEADLVLVPELRLFTRQERDRRETSERIRLRDGGDTTYTDVRATLRLEAEFYFRLIETTTRNVVAEGVVPVAVAEGVHYAVFDGDTALLRFPNADVRDRFDPNERKHAEANLLERLQAQAAEKLAAAAFEKILAQIL